MKFHCVHFDQERHLTQGSQNEACHIVWKENFSPKRGELSSDIPDSKLLSIERSARTEKMLWPAVRSGRTRNIKKDKYKWRGGKVNREIPDNRDTGFGCWHPELSWMPTADPVPYSSRLRHAGVPWPCLLSYLPFITTNMRFLFF